MFPTTRFITAGGQCLRSLACCAQGDPGQMQNTRGKHRAHMGKTWGLTSQQIFFF